MYLQGELTFSHLYSSAFYWALTQFAGSTQICPTNPREYIVAILITLVAFVISAAFVSSLTTSMTRLEILNTKNAKQFSLLHVYLVDNKISGHLASRIKRNAQHANLEQTRNTNESSVELLKIISEPL